ncbi:MAG TPA: condensation domain-containing protein, partial [Rhodocyclaceae bacterium]|nr:condensation domain-containing protein [Rhodocyclaceae bacterium]
MFRIACFAGKASEISFHENRDLRARELRPKIGNTHRVFLLSGAVDCSKLQNALHRLVLRHEALRTHFVKTNDGSFVRRVSATADVMVTHLDLTDFGPDDEVVKQFLGKAAAEGIGAQDYPLVKVRLLNLSHDRSIFFLTIAETVADGKSATMLVKELGELYVEQAGGKTANLPPLEYQLSDFVASQNAWMKTQEYKNNLQRICGKLNASLQASGGMEQLFFAPTSQESFLIRREFPHEFSEQVFRLATSLGVSAPTILMVASVITTARAREIPHIFFTTTFSNRHFAGVANIVGHLATTVPGFLDLRVEGKLSQHAKNLHRDLFAAMSQHGLTPIQEIGREVTQLFPPLPSGASIKFGKVVADVVMQP